MRILIICIVLAFCIPAMAQDELATLTRQIFQTSGQSILNDELIKTAARRSVTLEDRMTKLNAQLAEVRKAIRKLSAVTQPKPDTKGE